MFMKCGGARYRKDGHIVRRLVFTQVCICYDIRQRLLQDHWQLDITCGIAGCVVSTDKGPGSDEVRRRSI